MLKKQKNSNKIVGVAFFDDPHNKGITLVALIITIIVMLILVAVTLTIALGDNGIINNAKEATKEQKIATEKEKLLGLALEYYNAYKVDLSDETMEELAELAIRTGIDASNFTVFYNRGNTTATTEKEKEVILFRWDKVTESTDREKLTEEGIKELRGDANLDGFLTLEDCILISYAISYKVEFTEIQKEIASLYSHSIPDQATGTLIELILEGREEYQGGYVE